MFIKYYYNFFLIKFIYIYINLFYINIVMNLRYKSIKILTFDQINYLMMIGTDKIVIVTSELLD